MKVKLDLVFLRSAAGIFPLKLLWCKNLDHDRSADSRQYDEMLVLLAAMKKGVQYA